MIRPEIIAQSHSRHLGIKLRLWKDQDWVLQPRMSSKIKAAFSLFSVYADFQLKNYKEPMQTFVPDWPRSPVGVDMFTLHRKEYVVLVNYYSDFVGSCYSFSNHLSVLKRKVQQTWNPRCSCVRQWSAAYKSWVQTICWRVGLSAYDIFSGSSQGKWQGRVSSQGHQEFVQESPPGWQKSTLYSLLC